MLHQRHDVGEGFMEGEDVGIRRLEEVTMHAVEQRVGGFVGDDVVRQAGEDHAAGHVLGGSRVRRGESSRTAIRLYRRCNTHSPSRSACG